MTSAMSEEVPLMASVAKQRQYYSEIAPYYNDAFTFDPEDEHFIALRIDPAVFDFQCS